MRGKIHRDDRMTSRERLLAAYRGEELDRLPYWAKVYNNTWRLSQPERVRALSEEQLLDYIGADGLFGVGNGIRVIRPHVRVEQSRTDGVRTDVTHTPDGDLVEKWTEDPTTQSWHPTEFPVKTRDDLRRLRWLYTDVEFEPDEPALAEARARHEEIGQRGLTKTWAGTSPLMHLVQHVIGPVNTHLMLADFPGEMDELIELMHQVHLRRVVQIAGYTPADLLISGENTSTTLISPAQFERYCQRHLCDYGRAIGAEGKMHELHMCGLLGALLARIETIPAASIEAFTSPMLANSRLADGRRQAPSKTLVGGTNCCVWLWPLERIKSYITAELAACPDHRRIVLTTAGVAPPACGAEIFRETGQWIRTLPVRT